MQAFRAMWNTYEIDEKGVVTPSGVMSCTKPSSFVDSHDSAVIVEWEDVGHKLMIQFTQDQDKTEFVKLIRSTGKEDALVVIAPGEHGIRAYVFIDFGTGCLTYKGKSKEFDAVGKREGWQHVSQGLWKLASN